VSEGSGRGPGLRTRVESEGLLHPGSGVNAKDSTSDNRGANRSESMSSGMRDTGKKIRCYERGNFVYLVTACTMLDDSRWRRIGSGNGTRVHSCSSAVMWQSQRPQR
jgi:hypothetical protein